MPMSSEENKSVDINDAVVATEEGHIAQAFLNMLQMFSQSYDDYIKAQLLICPVEQVTRLRMMNEVKQSFVGFLADKVREGKDANDMLKPMTEEEYSSLANNTDFYGRL